MRVTLPQRRDTRIVRLAPTRVNEHKVAGTEGLSAAPSVRSAPEPRERT